METMNLRLAIRHFTSVCADSPKTNHFVMGRTKRHSMKRKESFTNMRLTGHELSWEERKRGVAEVGEAVVGELVHKM